MLTVWVCFLQVSLGPAAIGKGNELRVETSAWEGNRKYLINAILEALLLPDLLLKASSCLHQLTSYIGCRQWGVNY